MSLANCNKHLQAFGKATPEKCGQCNGAECQYPDGFLRVRGKVILSPEVRFWRMVNKDGPTPIHVPEIGHCWIWKGAFSTCCKLPYGKLNIAGEIVYAHRFSWEIHFGKTAKCVLHKCDNSLCVNPSHLFEGTKLENMRDMISKGRARHYGRNKAPK